MQRSCDRNDGIQLDCMSRQRLVFLRDYASTGQGNIGGKWVGRIEFHIVAEGVFFAHVVGGSHLHGETLRKKDPDIRQDTAEWRIVPEHEIELAALAKPERDKARIGLRNRIGRQGPRYFEREGNIHGLRIPGERNVNPRASFPMPFHREIKRDSVIPVVPHRAIAVVHVGLLPQLDHQVSLVIRNNPGGRIPVIAIAENLLCVQRLLDFLHRNARKGRRLLFVTGDKQG